MVVMHAFSSGICDICGTEVVSANTPCHKLCDECAASTYRCPQCGKVDNELLVNAINTVVQEKNSGAIDIYTALTNINKILSKAAFKNRTN